MKKLSFEAFGFSYPDGEKIISELSFSLDEGDFLLLCGRSGSGKSTLLRNIKPSLSPCGQTTGRIALDGIDVRTLDERQMAARIGFVAQDPDDQLVTDKVWHEMAFGLESLGAEPDVIRRRTAEMASFFGIKDWFHRDVSELSGGQKQILVIASVMTLRPEILILDEPTSQLDPIAAADLISILGRINRELGTTMIITDHRPEDAFAFANRLAILENGRLLAFGEPKNVGKELLGMKSDAFDIMPAATRIYARVGFGECPVTVRDGRRWLGEFAATHELLSVPDLRRECADEIVLSADEISFRYEKKLPDTVNGLSLKLRRGEFLALLGPNGSGKTTALKLLSGIINPWQGSIMRKGSVGMLPQDPKLLLIRDSVREELSGDEETVGRVVRLCRLEGLLERHPYDLSGGEMQRVALAKVLMAEPDILLLDEPTRGLDASFRKILASVINELTKRGKAVLAVSHDTEFCADHADRCALFFDGRIVSEGTPREFFGKMTYYTTPARRIAGELSDAVTVDELVYACGGNPAENESQAGSVASERQADIPRQKKLPKWRRAVGVVGIIDAVVSFVAALRSIDFTSLGNFGSGDLALTISFILSLAVVVFAFGSRKKSTGLTVREEKLSRRSVAASVILLAFVPLTVIFGMRLNFSRSYYLTSLLVAVECLLPLFIIFEGKRPSAREISLIAALCALGVAGRAAFFMFPQFKPVLALTIIVGAALGSERGFLVGAMTMLTSNILFSQGPWTPWQMLAMGLCGFFAGIIFRRSYSRLGLIIYGGLSAVIIYGGIMNFASAVIWQAEPTFGTILAYYATGIPMDLVHAAATIFFLFVAGEGMIKKLERITRK